MVQVFVVRIKGSAGSGDWGHRGRVGKRGGSARGSTVQLAAGAERRDYKLGIKKPEVKKSSLPTHDTTDQMNKGKMGIGYFILADDKLLDLSIAGEDVAQHQDFLLEVGREGALAVGVDPSVVKEGIALQEAWLGAERGTDERSRAMWAHDAHLRKVQDELDNSGSIAVRTFGNETAISGLPVSKSNMKRLQNLVLEDKIDMDPKNGWITWAGSQFNWNDLMTASNVRDLRLGGKSLGIVRMTILDD